jgi:hypothetical protein
MLQVAHLKMEQNQELNVWEDLKKEDFPWDFEDVHQVCVFDRKEQEKKG